MDNYSDADLSVIIGGSRPDMFCKKGFLKNFEKFTVKTPVSESLIR